MLFRSILLNNDVSLHNLVVLVVTIPTSPRLSKTEFVCERYCVSFIGHVLDRKNEKGKKPSPAICPARPASWPGAWQGAWPGLLCCPAGHDGRARPARPASPVQPHEKGPNGHILSSLLSSLLPHFSSPTFSNLLSSLSPIVDILLSLLSLNPSNSSC